MRGWTRRHFLVTSSLASGAVVGLRGLAPDARAQSASAQQMPPSPVSGGSQTTASIQPACRELLRQAATLAARDSFSPLAGAFAGGRILNEKTARSQMIGVAAAIANAVYHATGKRIRDLPLTVDRSFV